MDRQALWWNHIAGSVRYLADALDATLYQRVVLLEEAPFMEHFLEVLQERLVQRDSGLHIESGTADEWGAEQDVGGWLLNRFMPQADYHPMNGSRTQFMAERDALAGRVLIIRQVDQSSGWAGMAAEYARYSAPSNGLLILTYRGACPLQTARRGIIVLRWDSYITNYDMQLFASYCIAEQSGLSAGIKNYITQLASRLTGTNAEACSLLVAEELASDPLGRLKQLAHDDEFLASVYAITDFVNAVMWEAQIQTVFPVVERLRRQFIESYRRDFQKVLPRQDEFNKELRTPEDMELRHMWYYYFKFEGFANKEDERTFWMAYKARNKLAHLVPLNNTLTLDLLNLPTRS